jgi:hypothetical protein
MIRISIEQLTACSTPSRLPIEGDEQREQRNWIVRHAEDLPVEFDPDDVSRALSREAESAVAKARAARGLAAQDLGPHVPIVKLISVDERHLVVTVTTIKQEQDKAHEYLVAASAILSLLDKSVPIEDLQGIPRRFWRLLVGETR